ncbi:MAG: efflux RND transporter periplasmic adaptor subunit [Brumimicrobium sp.]
MKNILKNKYFLAVLVLLVGVLIGWIVKPSGEKEASESQATEAKDQIWTCSMHPQIKKKEPGDCPICGMDLIPQDSEDNNKALDPEALEMSPTAMKLASVQTQKVGDDLSEKSVRLNGKIQVDERLRNTQPSHIPGRIEKLLVNFTGEFVKEGQLLAYVYSPELVSTQEELLEAQKVKDAQPMLFESAKNKLKNWKISEAQIDKILAQDKPIESFPVRADFSGYVTNLLASHGQYVKQGQPIYEIADLSSVWVMFDVYESDLQWVNEGDVVEYTVASIPGETFTGKISYMDLVINPKTRVAKARIVASNKGLKLKPEMFVSGIIKSKIEDQENRLIIPKSAVMWTGKRSVVYVKNETEGMVSFKMREIELGAGLGDAYVVESGLKSGEEIAVHGTFSIDAAAQLAGKPSMMNPEGGSEMKGHNHGGENGSSSGSSTKQTEKMTISDKSKKSLQQLFESYFKLKTALGDDDFENAQKYGVQMKNTLDKVDMSLFKDKEHKIWMKQSSNLKSHLKHISHHESIKKLRDDFIEISNVMIAITTTFDPLTETIYLQYCPMVNDDQGAKWLSKEKEIFNPYFGEKMLKCGETKKTIE